MSEAAKTDVAREQTRARLLAAAREVFSERGFQGATVREICRRAGANGAAVNYYFGSKDCLLAEALNFTPLAALQKANADQSPEVRLRLFVRDFMLMLLDEKNPSSQCRMMARELADPTPALDKIVREAIAPLHKFLENLVREILDNEVGPAELRRGVYSLLGQCVFYSHSRPVLQRLNGSLRYDVAEIESIAEHISGFSLAGIRRSLQPPADAESVAREAA